VNGELAGRVEAIGADGWVLVRDGRRADEYPVERLSRAN
jgi:hypothetical protein